MADLLAIISHDRKRPLGPEDLAGLTASHRELRGASPHSKSADCDWAAVRVLDGVEPSAIGVEDGEGGWTAWAGSLRGAGPGGQLEQLDGQFSLIRLDREGGLTVATDPLGLKPLFVAEREGRTYVASSALVLARHLRLAPSRLGIETFLAAGNQLGRQTPWEGVERLGPGEAIRFTATGRKRANYWQPQIDEEVLALGFSECADACIERAGADLAAGFGAKPPWLDLTGGFDTRLLALLAAHAGLRFDANTSGEAADEDVAIARRLAKTGGWPWTQIEPPAESGEQLPARLTEAVAWGDGHLDALPLTEVMAGHRRKAASAVELLNGGGGEHFRDYAWGHELLRPGRSRGVSIDRLISWRILNPIDRSIFRADPAAAVAAGLREELERRLAPFAAAPNTFQNDVAYAFKATGHFGAYQAVAGADLHMELPFYSRAAFVCAISASPRHRAYHRLMREMMHRLDPALAAVPTETGGPAEPLRPGNLHRFAAYPWRRGRRFAARVRGRLAPAGGPPSPRQLAFGKAIAALRAEGRIDPARMRSAALYDGPRLRELLDAAAQQPAAVDWNTVGRIVTVELALEAADAAL
jgi:asparagine synthase (glutamine-hydrolysing)